MKKDSQPKPKPLWERDPQAPQMPGDMHDKGYDNDVPITSWVRSDGTKRPHFDKGNAWRGGKLRKD
jgi:hypothetical protein